MPLNLDYYYGTEADQYSFYRIPKILLTDLRYRNVSIESKVLYGLLLDRMGLSVKNGWMDSDRRVYIYFTQEDAMGLMSCGKDKTTKLFRELEVIGLIDRKKQGQGRPTRIYVKNFTLPPDPNQPQQGPQTLPSPGPNQFQQGPKIPPFPDFHQFQQGPQTPPPPASQTADFPQSRPLDSAAVKTAEKPLSAPLETFQQIVGGPIEAGCYLPQRVMLICNSEGKHLGLPPNRPNPNDITDFIAGTFLLCSFEGEHFASLSLAQQQEFTAFFALPSSDTP